MKESVIRSGSIDDFNVDNEGLNINELTSFIQKKEWIDEKIKFLQDLPPIIVLEPLPPLNSLTTIEELKEWSKEYDNLELEIETYDMGDLAKLKEFAKNASKNNLSIEDTDLIEITLTTLVSVDKLLYLLRQRKKALNLLNSRLKWESQIASAWAEHRKILNDLPRFLTKSRWTLPKELNSRSRKTSTAERPLIHDQSSVSSSTTTSPTTTTTTTTQNTPSPSFPSPRTLSVSLASLVNSNSNSSHSNSSSTSSNSSSIMSRTMRSEVLSLELASQKSKLHSLIQSTLPATSISLDKLIDTSPTVLPESFLLEQEKLEESCKLLTEGLAIFLTGMVNQWRQCDTIFWSIRNLELEGESIIRDLEEALLKLPDKKKAEVFESRLNVIENELQELEEKRDNGGFLPSPNHGSILEQEEENLKLIKILEKNVSRAKSIIERSKEGVESYNLAVASLEESRRIRNEMERINSQLNQFVISYTELSTASKPNLSLPSSLMVSESSTFYNDQSSILISAISDSISSIQPLLLQSSKILINLNKVGIDPNVRQAVRETMAGLSVIKEKVVGIIRAEDLDRRKLEAGRALEISIELSRKKIKDSRKEFERCIDESRWSNYGEVLSLNTSTTPNLNNLRQEIDSILSLPISTATSLLSTSHSELFTHLESQLATLLPQFEVCLKKDDLLNRTNLQREATALVLLNLNNFDLECINLSKDVQATILNLQSKTIVSETMDYLSKLQELETKFIKSNSTIFQSIPFLYSPLSSSSLSSTTTIPTTLLSFLPTFSQIPSINSPTFDLSKQDDLVKFEVNSKSASIGGQIDALKEQVTSVVHLSKAVEWDKELEVAETRLRDVSTSVEFAEPNEDSMNDADLQSLILTATNSISILTNSRIHLDSLSTLLAALQSEAISSSPLFNSHSSRQSLLESLVTQTLTTQERFSICLSTTNKIILDRDLALQVKELLKVKDWESRFQKVVSKLETSEEWSMTLQAAVQGSVDNLKAWRQKILFEREEFLSNENLLLIDTPLELLSIGEEESIAAINSIDDYRIKQQAIEVELDTVKELMNTLVEERSLEDLESTAMTTSLSSLLNSTQIHANSIKAACDLLADEIDGVEIENSTWENSRLNKIEQRRKSEVENRAKLILEEETRLEEIEAARVEAEEERIKEEIIKEEAARLLAIEVTRKELQEAERIQKVKLELEATNLLELESETKQAQLKEIEDTYKLQQVDHQIILSTMLEELKEFKLQLESTTLHDQPNPLSLSLGSPRPSSNLQILESARNDLIKNSVISTALSQLTMINQEQQASHQLLELSGSNFETSLGIEAQVDTIRGTIDELKSQTTLVIKRLNSSIATASVYLDLDDVFGPAIISNPFPINEEGEAEEDDIEKSPVVQLELQLASIPVDQWIDQAPFLQLPSLADAELLIKQLTPIYSQLLELSADEIVHNSPEFDYIRLELERKTVAANQIDSLAQFKSKVELADEALSTLLTSIDYATPGMMEQLSERSNSPESNSTSNVAIPEALFLAGNAITVVRKHAIHLLEDSRVLGHITRIESCFTDMTQMIEELNPQPRSFSSASASSDYSVSRIPTPARSNRSNSVSSSHHRLSISSSSRPPSSLFSSSSSSKISRSTSKPSLQSINTPSQRKRTSSSASSINSLATPRPRIYSNPTFSTTPRLPFIVPSPTKNSFGMSFGHSSSSTITRRLSPTPSSNRRDRYSSTQPRIISDSSPTFTRSTGTFSSSSRRSTLNAPPIPSSPIFAPSMSRSGSLSSSVSKRVYKADPKRRVDIALAKIVNDFPVSIYIKAAENNYKDESGMYWIGDPNPRLYFCRILRSKNVMLRTGGGWLNLSEFLHKHYNPNLNAPGSPSPNTGRWITPATPSRNQSALSSSSVSLSRSLSSGSITSPGRRLSDISTFSTPRKAPIVPWKF